MKFSAAAAIACSVVVLATAVGEAWAGGRGSGGRSSSGARPAHAHHHHSHTRVFVGSSFYYGPYYPAPYYYPVAPVYVAPPGPPPVYIEQGQDPAATWYYCQSARAYYPYVSECPEGWQPVVPDDDPQPAG